MIATTGAIVATPQAVLPYKVVFSIEGKMIAERFVTSSLAGQELIDALLPTLYGYDAGNA